MTIIKYAVSSFFKRNKKDDNLNEQRILYCTQIILIHTPSIETLLTFIDLC